MTLLSSRQVGGRAVAVITYFHPPSLPPCFTGHCKHSTSAGEVTPAVDPVTGSKGGLFSRGRGETDGGSAPRSRASAATEWRCSSSSVPGGWGGEMSVRVAVENDRIVAAGVQGPFGRGVHLLEPGGGVDLLAEGASGASSASWASGSQRESFSPTLS